MKIFHHLQFLFCNYVQVTADRDYVPGEQVKYYFFHRILYVLYVTLASFVVVIV